MSDRDATKLRTVAFFDYAAPFKGRTFGAPLARFTDVGFCASDRANRLPLPHRRETRGRRYGRRLQSGGRQARSAHRECRPQMAPRPSRAFGTAFLLMCSVVKSLVALGLRATRG
jgi:hypothetical protein